MHRRTPTLALAVLVAAGVAAGVALAGCGDSGSGTRPAGSSTSGAAGFPVTVGAVTLDQRPTKIISLSATATEMLYAVGAGGQVVAVDDQSNYPSNAPKTDLSGLKPNTEAIANRRPDLVVISNDLDKIKDQLTALKIPVYLAEAARTLDDSYREINDLGRLTGHVSEAATTVQRMRTDIDVLVKSVKPRAHKLTYFHELDPTLYTATSKTFLGSVYALFGLVNVADPADTTGGGYPQLSTEALIKANPDLYFLADTKCCQESLQTVGKRPGFTGITAVGKGRVVALDDDVASRWGPRIVDFARAVADAVAKVPAE